MIQFSKFKILFLVFFLAIFGKAKSQSIVPNPSFESYSGCPTSLSQISNAIPWLNGSTSSPDFFHACTSGNVSVPYNFAGYQEAYAGDGYAGIIAFNSSTSTSTSTTWKEYISAQLIDSLEEGDLCYFSFYVSLANNSKYATANLGAYFSDSILVGCPGSFYALNCFQPQIVENNFITDTMGWTLISGSFIAEGGENYVTIGHFEDIVTYDSLLGGNTPFSYYYIDEIGEISMPVNGFSDTTVCENISVLLNANEFSSDWEISEYVWQDGSTDSTFLAADEGFYWVDIFFDNGSHFRDSVEVIHTIAPQVEFLGNDTNLCENEIIYLASSIDFASILWIDGSTDSTLFVREEGWYWAEITSEDGCTVLDSIYVNYGIHVALNFGNDTSICTGDFIELVAPVPNAEFHWQDGSSDSIFTISESGTYWMEIIDSNYCYIRDSIYVHVYGSPLSMDLLSDTSIQFCEGEELTILLPDSNVQFTWYNGDTSSSITITYPGIYWVEITDSCQTYADTMLVRGCSTEFVMPNAFSPNGDGLNDMFGPEFMSNIANGTMVVYNRWGMKIFETDDLSTGWDGTYKETECPMENYIWYVKLTDFNGIEYIYKGNVVLIR
mgnify:CR=1 FL=1